MGICATSRGAVTLIAPACARRLNDTCMRSRWCISSSWVIVGGAVGVAWQQPALAVLCSLPCGRPTPCLPRWAHVVRPRVKQGMRAHRAQQPRHRPLPNNMHSTTSTDPLSCATHPIPCLHTWPEHDVHAAIVYVMLGPRLQAGDACPQRLSQPFCALPSLRGPCNHASPHTVQHQCVHATHLSRQTAGSCLQLLAPGAAPQRAPQPAQQPGWTAQRTTARCCLCGGANSTNSSSSSRRRWGCCEPQACASTVLQHMRALTGSCYARAAAQTHLAAPACTAAARPRSAPPAQAR